MSKIVISYRRSDSAALARLLYDRLCAHYRPRYGDDAVYMDVMRTRRGKDYHLQFNQAVRQCGVMLAIIGPNWFGGTKPGHTRITDADDPVRLELETATRLGVQILPVLVDEAEMPKANRLPRDLRYLTRLDAPSVDSGRDFDLHIQHLISDIDALINDPHRLPGPAAVMPQSEAGSRAGASPSVGIPAEPDQGIGKTPLGLTAAILRAAQSMAASRHKPLALTSIALVACIGAAGVWLLSQRGSYTPASAPVSDISSNVAEPKAGPVGIDRGGALVTDVPVTIKPLTQNAKELRSIAVSPDGQLIAVAGDDGVIRLWNAETFRLENTIRLRSTANTGVHRIAFSARGDLIYSVGRDRNVHILNPVMPSSEALLQPEPNSAATHLIGLAAFPRKDEGMNWVAAGGDDGCFRIWHVGERDTPIVWKYVSGGDDHFNKPCDQLAKVEKGREIQTISYSPNPVGAYAVGSRDGTVFLFSVQKEARKIEAHKGPVWEVAFSPDGERIASAGADAKIRTWNVADQRPLRTLSKHTHSVSSLAWSSNGQWLVSGGGDATVRLWDSTTGNQVGEPFQGHRKDVQAVTFHPTRDWLLSASEDGTFRVWDVKSRTAMLTIVAFDDGQHLVAHRSGSFTGSPGVGRQIIMTYPMRTTDGVIEHVATDEEKSHFYVPPDEFGARLRSGM